MSREGVGRPVVGDSKILHVVGEGARQEFISGFGGPAVGEQGILRGFG